MDIANKPALVVTSPIECRIPGSEIINCLLFVLFSPTVVQHFREGFEVNETLLSGKECMVV